MAKPKFRVCVKNKDGSSITYTDYKGEERTSLTCPIGALFENKFGGLDFALERKVTLDPEKHFVGAYTNEERGEQKSTKGAGKKTGEDLFE